MSHTRKSKLDRVALLGLLLCCSIWGLNQVAAKAGLSEIGPLWQAGLRSLNVAMAAAMVMGEALRQITHTTP